MKKLLIITLLFLLIVPAVHSQVISPDPSVAVFVTGAYVTWSTTTAGNSRVDYGTTTAYGSNVTNSSSVTHHALTITGLSAATTYHYKVTTGSTVSGDYTFTTLSNPTGTVRTVGSGKTHATIQACVNAMSSGDTCVVYSGTYAETVTIGTGSAGNYKTVLAQEAATVTGFNASGKNYSAVKGFKIGTGGIDATSAATYITFDNNYLVAPSGNAIDFDGDNDVYHQWLTISNNIIYDAGYVGINISGTNILIDNNDIIKQGDDCIYDGILTYSVIRNNKCHDYNPADKGVVGDDHLDFLQWDGWGNPTYRLSYTLIENNWNARCIDTTGNCHFLISRGDSSSPQNLIIRYNTVAGPYDGSIMTFGTNEGNHAQRIYNNTAATGERSAEGGAFYSSYYANYTKSLNNICYDCANGNYGPWDTGTGIVNNYNVARDTSNPTATWDARYQAEATYATLKNLNPSFVNYPYDLSLGLSSVLIEAGGNLTTVTSGCGSSTLTLADNRWFQAGWAGVQADTLAIGATVSAAIVRQITGVTHSGTASTSSGTVTFAATVACTNGDKVWLYSKSDGTRVLYGTAPDIGAYEYTGDGDYTAPAVTITTSSPQAISSDSLTVTGTASDAVGVVGCKYRIGLEPSYSYGTMCTGTTSWSCATSGYATGANTLYVECYDAALNYSSGHSITVNYNVTPPTPGVIQGLRVTGGSIQ